MTTDNCEKIKHGLAWVRAALDCKTWHWDGDQREAAEIDLAAANEALSVIAVPVPINPKGPFAAGVWAAVKWVEQRRDDYIREHGTTDPETGTVEYPGDGEQYVGELDEIVEGLQKLAGA